MKYAIIRSRGAVIICIQNIENSEVSLEQMLNFFLIQAGSGAPEWHAM